LRDAFVSAPFVVLALTFFACCAAHAGPIFHTVTYAQTCGLAPLAAVTIYSVEGLAGLGGRLALGVLADRLGVKRVLIAGLAIQAVAAFTFIFASQLGEFYAVAATFGFAYGGVMPLYAVLAREYFGQRILGAVFGARHGVEPRDGARAGHRRLDLRQLRPVHLDVRLLLRDRLRRRGDRARVPAFSQSGNSRSILAKEAIMYVDAVVVPVPKRKLSAYLAMARRSARSGVSTARWNTLSALPTT